MIYSRKIVLNFAGNFGPFNISTGTVKYLLGLEITFILMRNTLHREYIIVSLTQELRLGLKLDLKRPIFNPTMNSLVH